MSAEELAITLANDTQCSMCIYFKTDKCPKDYGVYDENCCRENIEAWLNSEVEE